MYDLFYKQQRMDDPTFYIIIGVIGLLLGVSEGLGWSDYDANGILDLMRVLLTNRQNK